MANNNRPPISEDELLKSIAQDNISGPSGTIDSLDNVEQLDEDALSKEIAQEQQYGGRGGEAFLNRAAAAASFGLSTPILKGLGVSEERLREVPERSPLFAGAGTVTGVVGPALLTGGESLVAKAISAPMREVTALGELAGTGMGKLVEGRVRSGAVKQILKESAVGLAEGGAYGAGNFVDEAALGKTDANAQNLVASVGAGAMLGGVGGGVLGGIKASMPMVRKGIAPLSEKISSAARNIVDPEIAAGELVGIKPDKMASIVSTRAGKDFQKDLPAYLVNKLELRNFGAAEDLVAANARIKKASNAAIEDTVNALDMHAAANPTLLPPRAEVYDRLLSKLDDYQKKFINDPKLYSAELNTVEAFAEGLHTRALKKSASGTAAETSLKELDTLRKQYQGIKYKGGGASESFRAEVAQTLRGELRDIVDESATKVASNSLDPSVQKLATDLKSANKDYWTASLLEKPLSKKLNTKGLMSLQDIVEGSVVGAATGSGPLGAATSLARRLGKSDLRRRAVILADLKGQSMAVEKAVKEAVTNFVSKTKRPLRALSLKTLVNSGFAVDYDNGHMPANKKEAFKNVASNLEQLNNDQDTLLTRLAKSTARVSIAAPNIAQETQNTLLRSVNFLQSKIPHAPSSTTMFPKPYEPSSMELAKFERYMQAVEHPLSVLEDLQKGTLTREHVEALQAVYPAIYSNLRQEILDAATGPDADMSYNKKLQLGILFNVPTDASMEPQNIAGLQANFMPQNDPKLAESTGAIKPSSTSVSSMKMSGRLQTDVEKTANRKAQS